MTPLLSKQIVFAILIGLRSFFNTSRSLLKRMGVAANVDIEPDSQTALADATESLPGVLCACVPGAGGVDAIFAITLSASGRDSVEHMWGTWSSGDGGVVCPLLLSERVADEGGHAGVAVNTAIGWES